MTDHISNASDHATMQGDGSRPALAPRQAFKPHVARKPKTTKRAPFLPDHPRAVHGLIGQPHHKGHSKR